MRYRDKSGRRRLESTHTDDWHVAQRHLRERLQSRDNNTLEVIRKGEQMLFSTWADFFPGALFQAADSSRQDT